jgi:hypothetical protein
MNKYRVKLYCKDKVYNYTITDVCYTDNVFQAKNIIINKYKAYHNIVKDKTLIYRI